MLDDAGQEPPDPAAADWPTFGLAADVRPALARAQARHQACALVTLVKAEGGAPRPPGSQMLVSAGELSGFLSGGCVEADVALHARTVLQDGAPRRLVYGRGSPYPDIRLLCGARIELLVERIGPDDPAARALAALADARRPAIYATDGTRRLCTPQDEPPAAFEGETVRLLHRPRPRLIVVGADPTALAIAQVGAACGLETALVRPKGPATPPPAPGVAYLTAPAGEALAAAALDPWTHVAVATHDLQTDSEALAAALPSSAAYVGVLGARRRIPERLADLRARGVDEAALARLRAPIGLAGGGKAPFEIAVAVLAEIMAAAPQGPTVVQPG